MVYLSPYELIDLLNGRTYSYILFSSENQDELCMGIPAVFSFEFRSILTHVNPCRVVFSGDGQSLTLLMIDHAELDESVPVLGDIITIVCRCNHGMTEHRFKFVMR